MKKYNRVLLKLSGESLMGTKDFGIDPVRLQQYAKDIKSAYSLGVEIAIVIGGGNIFRGLKGSSEGFDRVKADQMGMLATCINSLALASALENEDIKAKVLTSTAMEPIAEHYSAEKAREYVKNGYITIIAGGTGNPYFTTDTGAALRGIEIKADVMLKGTRVDGIYSADPEKDPSATRYNKITYSEVLKKNLRVMDLTATTLCMENKLPIIVFDMDSSGNLIKVLSGEQIGSIVKAE